MALVWRFINGSMKQVDDGVPESTGDTDAQVQKMRERAQGSSASAINATNGSQQTQTTPLQVGNNGLTQLHSGQDNINNAQQGTTNAPQTAQTTQPVATAPVVQTQPTEQNTQPAANEQVNTPSTAQAEYTNALGGLTDAEKNYNDFINNPTKGYESILDAFGKKETPDEKNSREKKEKNKRNLLALVQLGSALGNLVTAGTGGKMGGESAATPNLVGAYDKNLANERTKRMKRDAERETARQNAINTNYKTIKGQYDNAFKRFQDAQKQVKAENDAKTKEEERKLKQQQQANADAYKKAKMENDEAYRKSQLNLAWARQNLAKEKFEYQKEHPTNGGRGTSKKPTPFPVENGAGVYNIDVNLLSKPSVLGSLKSGLSETYRKELDDLLAQQSYRNVQKDIEDLMGRYMQDTNQHRNGDGSETAEWQNFKNMMNVLQDGTTSEESDEGAFDINDFENYGAEQVPDKFTFNRPK